MKFKKRPVIIEAVQFLPNEESTRRILDLGTHSNCKAEVLVEPQGNYNLYIHTLEGVMEATIGDWIIRGVSGELYPCKPDIFLQTYEPVLD